MKYRKVGRTGLNVSVLSLGSWLTYGNTTDSETATAVIHAAYSAGINSFDTANVYARGEAEKVVGHSRKHVFEQVHASLRRLGTDYVDIFYCHRFDPQTPIYETLRTIDDLIRQGKILYAGVSEWTATQITDIEDEVVPTCEKHGLSQIVFSPLAQGMLTGKYQKDQPAPHGSRASDPRTAPFVERYFTEANFVKVEKLKTLAGELNLPLSNLSLAWVLAQPNITSAIIGASRPEQVLENIKAADVRLSQDVVEEIEDILDGE
ncbi:MAG: voltage-gated potassium channel [Anaerosporomusa subterranea]|nr:voltage-gated potassium channel [Anaerosporomusa subterranea]